MDITSNEDDAERQAFLPNDTDIEEKTSSVAGSSAFKHCRHYIRLAVEIFMALVILILSIRVILDNDGKKSKRSPVPDCMSTILSILLGCRR